jgi:hypothetical protein
VAVVRSIDGSEPAPGAGSVMAKHERICPAPAAAEMRSLRGVAVAHQVDHVRLVGRRAVQRRSAKEAAAGFLQNLGTRLPVEPEPAVPRAADGGVDACLPGQTLQPPDHDVKALHVVRQYRVFARACCSTNCRTLPRSSAILVPMVIIPAWCRWT